MHAFAVVERSARFVVLNSCPTYLAAPLGGTVSTRALLAERLAIISADQARRL